MMLKRLFDFSLAVIGLLVLSPVLIACAVAVKATSSGPIFYRGARTGKGGVPFRIYKFRSMVIDAEKIGGSTTGKNDPRVTAIGRFLRKYKLDELPQLFNVFLGDMSFVGPRPEMSEYTNQYIGEERTILSVKPGITDFSSLEFRDLQEIVGEEYPDREFRREVLPRKIALRLEYVRRQSFTVDLQILLLTVWYVSIKPLDKWRWKQLRSPQRARK